jgi:hypothetical protein
MLNIKNKPIEDDKFHELCVQVLTVDKAILFCAMAHKSGYLVSLATNHNSNGRETRDHIRIEDIVRDDLDPRSPRFLSDMELEKYLYQSGIMWGIQKSWQKKLGHVRHFVSYYDAMPLVTIPLDNSHFLFLGIDSTKHPNVERIVLHKLGPMLRKAS